jgi:O-antigen/teichoic acid export membrane protein
MKQLSTTVLRNSAFGLASQMIIKILSFGFSVLIVRRLGAEAFGQYSAVAAFGALFLFIADLGLSPYAIREVARWRDLPDGVERANALYGNVLVLRLLLSLLAGVLALVAAWLSGRPLIMIGAIALNSVTVLLYAIQGTSEAVLSGFERLDLASGARVLNQLAFVFLGALALVLGFGYYGLIIATLLGVALMTYVCWRGVQRLGIHPVRAVAQTWPALLRASLPFGVIGFALGLSYKFDSVLLNIFRTDAETGYYNAAYNLVFSAAVFSNIFNTSLYPSLARQAVNDPGQLPKIYQRSLGYLILLALPIAVGVWALADQLVLLLFKAAYQPATPALQIVIWVLPWMFASEFLGYIVLISGQEKYVARSVLISTGFNVVLNLFMVPVFGFIGAAVMTVLTEVVLVGQYVLILRSLIKEFNWSKILLRPIVAAAIMGAVVIALRPLPLALNVAVGALVYGGLLLALGVLGKDEMSFLRSLRRPAEVA